MLSPFDIWAPIIRAPFSGDVTQEITPRVFSPDIQGVPEIEERVQTEVASYGKQLGKLLEAVKLLAETTGTPVPEIDNLIAGVEAVKTASKADLRARAEAALDRLRAVDEGEWRAVLAAGRGAADKAPDSPQG